EKMFNLDLPVSKQYLLYLNDLSPVSIHNKSEKESHIYLNDDDYSYSELFSVSESRTIVIKKPYLRRTYYTREKVSDVLWKFIPETVILAIVAISIAIFFGILFGVLAALYKGTFIDGASLIISTLGMSGPSFFMAVVISWIGITIWYEITMIPLLPFIFMLTGGLLGVIFNKRIARKRFVNFSWAFLFESLFKGLIFGCIAWIVGYSLNSIFASDTVLWIDLFAEFGGTGLNPGSLHTSNDIGEPQT